MQKLKVLWIDDEEEQLKQGELPKTFESFFEVDRRFSHEHFLELKPGNVDFDIAVTDFNLVSHQIIGNSAKNAGLEADAAGFLIGLLLASGRPGKPCAIIPFSGDQRQFGDVWKLANHYAPPWITVADGKKESKLDSEALDILSSSARHFRSSLTKSISDGRCTISSATEKLVLNSGMPSLNGDELVILHFADHTRELKIGSLFFDLSEGRRSQRMVDAKKIKAFFEPFLQDAPISMRAKQLALNFWETSLTPLSIAEFLASSEPPRRRKKSHLLRKTNVNSAGKTKDDRLDNTIVMYAVLYSLVKSYVSTVTLKEAMTLISDDERINEEDVLIVDIPSLLSARLEEGANIKSVISALDETVKTLSLPTVSEQPPENLQELLDLIDNEPRLFSWPARFHRAVEPLPAKAPPYSSVDLNSNKHRSKYLLPFQKSGTLGVAASEVGFDRGALVACINNGLSSGLTDEQRLVARRFAKQMVPFGLTQPAFTLD